MLRQKNALPSGIGRTFSLGGARSAIFNWTPPSDRWREESNNKAEPHMQSWTPVIDFGSFEELLAGRLTSNTEGVEDNLQTVLRAIIRKMSTCIIARERTQHH